MSTNIKNLKSPKELFEEKRSKSLEESARLEEVEIREEDKKILPPKYFFSENKKGEVLVEDEQVKEEIFDTEESENDFYEDQLSLLKTRLLRIENSIPKSIDPTEVLNLLKNKINSIPKQKDYSFDIQSIRSDLVRIENSIPNPKPFDPTDLHRDISLLKEKIEEVRSEIPEVPQPILYDDQLEDLKSLVEGVRDSVPVVPEVRYYEDELNSIIETINQVRSEIPELPEIKYYDDEISTIENRIEEIQNSIPEVRYYDEDLDNLKNQIDQVVEGLKVQIGEVRETIPTVKSYDEDIEDLDRKLNEVKNSIPQIPEIKSYDQDLENLQTKIDDVKGSIPTIPEIKYYDSDIKGLNEEIQQLYDKISSIKIPNEDVYFQRVKNLHTSFEEKNHKLLEKINYLEEIFEKFNEQTILKEDLSEPPKVNNSDPLTPLDQKFVTLDQLQEHYRLFINRVQQQLATIGGGGETQLKYLDDIVGIATNPSAYNNKFLKYNHDIGKFEFGTVGGGGGGASDLQSLTDVDVSNLNDGYLMIWNAASSTFVFVSPQTYFGINNDANPDPDIDDYGTY